GQGLVHPVAEVIEVEFPQSQAARGPGEALQVPGERECLAAHGLNRLKDPVADRDAMVEGWQPCFTCVHYAAGAVPGSGDPDFHARSPIPRVSWLARPGPHPALSSRGVTDSGRRGPGARVREYRSEAMRVFRPSFPLLDRAGRRESPNTSQMAIIWATLVRPLAACSQ